MSEERTPNSERARYVLVLLTILFEGGLVVLALVLGWIFAQPPLGHFAFLGAGLLAGLVATLPMIVAYVIVSHWPIGPFRKIKEFTDLHIRPLFRPCTIVDLVGISCLAGLGEEMLFRGFLQDVLIERYHVPWWAALGIASIVFGVLHPVTFTYIVVVAMMGLYLGWLYLATGNLLAPMVAHAAYDFFALVYMLYGPGSADDDKAEG
jgi:hypothetical protein